MREYSPPRMACWHIRRRTVCTEAWKSLAHSRWECKYHVVFVPKYRRKAVDGEIRASLGGIFHELARQKECRIVEGHLLADHVHTRLGRFHTKRLRTGSDSGGHQCLGDLFTRIAASEEPLGEGE